MTPTPIPWATPTPLIDPTAAGTPVLYALNSYGDSLAENLVQGYSVANAYSYIDYFWFAIILVIVLMCIWIIIGQLKSL